MSGEDDTRAGAPSAEPEREELRRRADEAVAAGDDITAAPLLAALGDHAEAAHRFSRVIDGRPVDAETVEYYYRLGEALVGAGDPEEALMAFRAVDDYYPGYRESYARIEELERRLTPPSPEPPPQEDAAAGASIGRVQLARKTLEGPPVQSRFEMLRELHQGASGVVTLARDTARQRGVAVKLLGGDPPPGPKVLERLQVDLRLASGLVHRNIVQIFDVGVIGGRPYVSMEPVEGESVKALLDRGQWLDSAGSVHIVYQLCDALRHAHDQGIVHGRLKPSSVLISDIRDEVKLTGFGLRALSGPPLQGEDAEGLVGFQAPEQLAGGRIDERADLFAIGVLLFRMLTGKMPYEGPDRDTRPSPMLLASPDVPAPLGNLVDRLLKRDPRDRPPDVQSVLNKLASVSATYSAVHRAVTRRRRR